MAGRGRLYGRIAPVLHGASRRVGAHRRTLRRQIVVRHQSIPLGLGRRVVLAADFHADRTFFPASRVREVVDAINAVHDVDLVAMPGDFVGHDVFAVEWLADELARLERPAFATLGNHDHMEGADIVEAALVSCGVDVLTNREVDLGLRGVRVRLIGVDSCFAGVPEPGAIDERARDGVPNIVLGHEPWLATRHRQALHLAGHTHHGQVRIPGLPAPYLPSWSRPYAEGLHVVEDGPTPRFVYTTGGLGSTTIPVRIGVPPEIVVLDL